MKKWIIFAVLAALLVAGILIAEKLSEPNIPNTPQNEESSTTEETYSEEDLKLMEKTYQEYQEMNDQEKDDFKNSFSSLSVYIDWYWQAKEEYEASRDVVIIRPGQSIDIGDLLGGEK